jgi:hypothetical protein
MTWHTDPPRHQGEYLVVDSWTKREVAAWRPDLGWCIRGKWVGHDGAACWMELPEIPVNVVRERW